MTSTRRVVVVLGLGLVGCAGLIGVPDLTYDEAAPQGTVDGATPPPGADGGPTSTPDGSDGECNANLASDPEHCGRCNRRCGGGACENGQCQPVTLADGIDFPQQLAVDATHLYWASFNDQVIRRVKLDGTGTPETLASAVVDAIGVARDGDDLFWSGREGVFRCRLSGGDGGPCTAQRVSNVRYSRNLFVSNGALFFANESDVRRAAPTPAGPETVYGEPVAQPWSVAANAQFVYLTSSSRGLQRAPIGGLDGGDSDEVGPLDSKIVASYVAVEGDSVFWSYRDDATDTGAVYSQKHDNPAARVTYTAATTWPLGVAADARYVYWTDRGTLTAEPSGASNGDGRLLACPRAGCGPEPIVVARGLRGGGHITLDDGFIYFAENNNFAAGGRVRKVAKP